VPVDLAEGQQPPDQVEQWPYFQGLTMEPATRIERSNPSSVRL
jgi:hypothetical protein